MKSLLFALVLACLGFSASAISPDKLTKEEKKARKDSIKAAEMVGAHRKGGGIKLDNIRLDDEQQALLLSDIEYVDYNAEWKSLRNKRNWGKGLTIAGGVCAGAGAGFVVFGLGEVLAGVLVAVFTFGAGEDAMKDIMGRGGLHIGIGAGLGAVGAAGIATGIPLITTSNKKMKAICESYNSAGHRIDKELILGPTNSGVGIAFNF